MEQETTVLYAPSEKTVVVSSIKMSNETDKIFPALAKCQGETEAATKSADNPFFKSKYADLSEIIYVLQKPMLANGLALVQCPTGMEGKVRLTSLLTHSSGQFIISEFEMTPKDGSPQGVGSCITYMRRYSMGAIGRVASEPDDDGNAASGKKVEKKVTPDDFNI